MDKEHSQVEDRYNIEFQRNCLLFISSLSEQPLSVIAKKHNIASENHELDCKGIYFEYLHCLLLV